MRKTLAPSLAVLLLMALGMLFAACGSSSGSAATSDGSEVVATAAQTAAETSVSTSAGATVASDPMVTNGSSAETTYTADETSYTSATKSIIISTVSTGSGDDTLTYYVADIQLADPLDLESAFSRGTFGGKAQDTSTIADSVEAIVAINGDYYSARDDGIVIRNGVIYRDAPARTGLAIYKDGTMKVYDEATTTAERLLADGVWNTYSFGPGLLVDGQVAEGLDTYEAEADARHPIQGANPRTGVGIIDANHYVFVVVDGRSPGYSRGVTLTELAQIFQGLGCSTAYNLDGGGSSTLYFMGKVVNDPSQRNGERSVSDILFVN